MSATQPRPRCGREYRQREDFAERERRGCEVCGEWFPAMMLEWHHVDGHPGPYRTRRPIYDQPKAAYLAERALCICVCANCHKVADYERDNA